MVFIHTGRMSAAIDMRTALRLKDEQCEHSAVFYE